MMPAISDPEFNRLDHEVRENIRAHVAICERMAANPRGVIHAAAQEAFAAKGQRGMSSKRILSRYYDYKHSGDWRVFAPKKSLRAMDTYLPLEFIEYWHGLVLENKRKTRPAWRKLVEIWKDETNHIPGYGNWRAWWSRQTGHEFDGPTCPPDLPHGWSYETLNRLKPDRAEISLARFGIAPSRHLFPHIIGTRDGLRPMEYLAFDDVELDFLVVVPGVERPCKLRALVCKDVATDCWLRFVLRPALVREDGTQDGLKLRDMKRLCLELLMNFGYPQDYASHWIVERGTATLPEADILALAELSAGMIQVHQTSMISGKVLLGGYADKSVGNSWAKAWIESGFNILHNELATVPGQKGRRYDLAPAELEARKKAATELLRAGKALPPELRASLRLPFLDIYQAHTAIFDAFMRINLIQDHKCEGFQQIVQWRIADGHPWSNYDELLKLPPAMMDHVQMQHFVETRFERWARMVKDVSIIKMAEEFAPRWMDEHRKVKVQNYQIKFAFEGKTHTYYARESGLLIENQEYLAYFNPFDMDRIYLTNANGAYRGYLPRVHAVTRADQEALSQRTADVTHTLNKHIAAIRQKQRTVIEQSIADAEANIAVFEETASTPIIDLTAAIAAREAERAQDASRRNAALHLDAADLLDAPAAEPADDAAEPIKFDPSMLLD